MKEMRDRIDLPEEVDKNGKVLLAWLDGLSDDLLSVLQRIKSNLPDDKTSFSCVPSLEKLLDECRVAKNIVYVGEGLHCLKRSCELSSEIIIQGVGAASKTLIENSEGGRLLFDVMNRGSSFSNMCLVGSKLKFVVVVRIGCCRMSNVTVQGSHDNVAILVQSGAEFYAESCTFTDCSVAVEAREGSKITLKGCVIQNNINGLVFQSSNVNLENCHFIDNTQSAVVQFGGSESVSESNGASGIMLESLQGVTAKGITFSGNKVNISRNIYNDPL
ncbi:hypothetical protein LSTR_LSTR010852 [Laodelphax striatellus]|uniref:Right handed beta helix domain-containing protein n=1 Tax=Laodelphax striatellus TaxID=195883 RepID=A0A482WT41_LAOST|nr:hypothetical protein LSTR_LSTR010852 [Laodelphax striatellus]